MIEVSPEKKIASKKPGTSDVTRATFLSFLYLVVVQLLIGIRPEHVISLLALNVLYYLSGLTKKLVIGHLVFVLYLTIFDCMKAFPNYWFSSVHIQDLYTLEKDWFGTLYNGVLLTPNEYLNKVATPFLDVVSGLFYLCWLPVPLLFGLYLFFHKKKEFVFFYSAFLFVNLLGFVVYYTFPAAPPWYVQKFGFQLLLHTPGSAAGLVRFDDFFGIHLFESMYTKSSNVFAAMPSLHSAYPVIVLFYGLKNKLGWINLFFTIVVAGIWFAAVYSSHHYVLDVLCGALCAIVGLLLFEKLVVKIPFVRRNIQDYIKAIS